MKTTGFAPQSIASFGIVMFPKPVVPLGPVIVKATVVVVLERYDVIEALNICELVTFPLITRSTVSPLFVVDTTVVTDGVGVGDGFASGVSVTVEVPVGVAGGVEVEVGFGVPVAVAVSVGVGLGVGVEVDVGFGVGLGEGLGEGEGDGDGLGEGEGEGEGVGIGVGVTVCAFTCIVANTKNVNEIRKMIVRICCFFISFPSKFLVN
jgi:hypothetical protein